MKLETRNLKPVFVVVCVILASLTVGACSTLRRPLNDTNYASRSSLTPESTPTFQAYLPYVAFDPPDVTLARGPYLQSVTTSSIIVAWETDLPSPGKVVYGETEAYGSSVADPALDTRHAVTLTGLAPYTVYHYRVESGGEDATFRTAAGPAQTAFTFVVFGDTRTQHQIHRAVVERIAAQSPDFVLHTGDLVEFGNVAHEWETFFEIERELVARAPLFPTLGNHEHSVSRYLDLFYLPGNERWYSFDYGNARFVCLQVSGIGGFGPGTEQYAWLEETLAANTQLWLFVPPILRYRMAWRSACVRRCPRSLSSTG